VAGPLVIMPAGMVVFALVCGAAAPSQAAMVNDRSAKLPNDAQARSTYGAEVFIEVVP
jgi:hypothetical protein